MAQRHDRTASDQRSASTQPAIGDNPAKDRREIDQRCIVAKNRRRERLVLHSAVSPLLQPAEAGNGVEPLREQVVDHVEHRSEEHTSELQSLMRISYAVFCLKKTYHLFTYFTS